MKKKNKIAAVISPALAVAAMAAICAVFYGLPVPGVPRYGNYTKVDITRYKDGEAQTVTVTQATDDTDRQSGKPFMRFKLAPNMINFIKIAPGGIKDYSEVEYIYAFTMNDGSEKVFYICEGTISGGWEKTARQHKNSEYLTFKDITDGIYFGDVTGKIDIPDNFGA